MLPGEDGLSICRRLRARGDVPILMLTAKGDDVDRIVGLEVGADDYLAKPFNPREPAGAHSRGAAPRGASASVEAPAPRRTAQFAGLLADLDARTVRTADGTEVDLTSAEFDLLACFPGAPAPGALPRDQLLDWTRGRTRRSVRPHHRCLRQPACAASWRRWRPRPPPLIKTVRNGGYLFSSPVR